MVVRRSVFVGVVAASLALGPPRAGAAGEDTTAVVTVGSLTVTVADLEQRLARIPQAQLATFGKTPEEIKKAFVERVVVPDLLCAEEAGAKKLAQTDQRTADSVREALRVAIENEIKAQLASTPPSDTEVKAYYDANRSRFAAPVRIQIWRILLDREDDAKQLLAELKPGDAAARFGQLARERSVDEATKLRDGNLGFVRPDGQTNVPTVRVDPALFAAAEKVKDGEMVPQPVKEGERFAVVWRRGSVASVERTLQQEADSIKQQLSRKKLSDELSALVDGLQKSHVSEKSAHLLKYVAISADGDIRARERPGIAPRRAAATPAPRPGEQGLR